MTRTQAPSGVAASAGNGQNSISWASVVGASGYNIYWSTISGVTPSNGTKISELSGTAYTQTGLNNGTTYFYVVTAQNAGGESAASSQVSATPQIPVSGAPNGVAASPGNGQNVIGWSSVSGATSYNIYWSSSPGVTTSNGTKISGVSGTSYTQTGLANGTTYYYVVTAMNAGGESPAGSEASGTPQVPAPFVPTGVGVSAGVAQNTISWSSVSGATGYNIYWSTSTGVTTSNGTKISGVSGTSYIQTGLANGTPYYYVVTAANAGGESAPSIQASGTPQVLVPSAPTGVTVSAADARNVISWGSVSGATSYNIYWSTLSGVTTSNGTKISIFSGTSCTQLGRTNGTTYYYVVTAVNAGGESLASSEASGTPQVPIPSVPTGVGVSAGNFQNSISWNWVSWATSYNIYWSTSPGVTTTNGTKISGVSGTSYTQTGLVNGTTYYYVVTASNISGESDASSQATGAPHVPVPSAPTGLGVLQGVGQHVITWNSVSGAISYNIYWSTSTGVTTSNGTKISGISGTSYTHTGLANATNYFYVVTAVNAGGESGASLQYGAQTLYPPPAAPTGLGITAGNGANVVTWGTASGAFHYNLYWSTTPGVTTANGNKVLGIPGTSYLHSGLTNGTTYYYIVVAENIGGESASSGQASGTPHIPAPAVPSGVGVVAGNGQSVISWNSVSGATSYRIYWSTSTGVTTSNGTKISVVSGTSYTQTGLVNGTTYYYVVTAVNVGGESGASTQASALYTIPPTPSGTVVAPGGDQNVITWSTAPGASSYNLYWSTSPGVTTSTGTKISGIEGTSFTHSGLQWGTSYYYVLTAVNVMGESSPTAQQTGVPLISWTNYTTAQGLAFNGALSVSVSGANIYVGTAGGGVSVSNNGGTSWTTSNTSNGLNGNFVYGIYGSGSEMYAACSNIGVSYTSNGGSSWITYSNGVLGDGCVGVAVSGSTICAASITGFAMSVNGGTTWTSNSSGAFVVGATAVTISGANFYVGTAGLGLEVSTNSGSTWTNLTTAQGLVNNTILGVFLADSGATLYAATNGGLSKSTTGGSSWTNFTTSQGLGSNQVRTVWASGSTILAGTTGGLSVSSNGGASWSTYTTAQGLGGNVAYAAYMVGSKIYVATSGGLSVGQ